MSINSITQQIDATGQLRLPNANFLFLITASAGINITFSYGGTQEIFQNAIGGVQVGRLKKWDFAFLQGAAGTTVTLFYGTCTLREDITALQQQIATVAGTVNVAFAPASTLTSTQVAPGTGAASNVAQNLARKAITFSSPPTNIGTVFIQQAGKGAGFGIPLQPGTFITLTNTASIDVRNDSGAAVTINVDEET